MSGKFLSRHRTSITKLAALQNAFPFRRVLSCCWQIRQAPPRATFHGRKKN
jgi:hypothetical protein